MCAYHGAIDHLKLVRRDFRMVQSVQDILPQPDQRPAAELAINRRPFAEIFRKIPPRRPSPSDPENPIQNKAMITEFTTVRMPNSLDELFEEAPLIIRYQLAHQVRLPRGEELESQDAGQRNPFCQHGLN